MEGKIPSGRTAWVNLGATDVSGADRRREWTVTNCANCNDR